MRKLNWLKKPGKYGYLLLLLITIYFFSQNFIRENEDRTVKTAFAKCDTLVRTITVIGTAVPSVKMNIVSELSGVLEKVFVIEGDNVVKGQQLLKINSSLLNEKYLLTKQKVIETQLEIELIENELKRFETLYELNQIPKKQIDELKRKLAQLTEILTINQELLTIQRATIEKATIKAPIPGTVLFSSPLENGISISAGQALLSIVNLDSINIETQLNQDDALRVAVGQDAFITGSMMGCDDFSLRGKVTFMAPEIKTGMMKILVSTSERVPFKLGSAVKVKIPLSSLDKVLMVPIEAIKRFDKETYVFVVEEGVVRKRKVDIGNNNHSYVEITKESGLSEGSEVVIANFDQIKEGMKIGIQRK